MFYLFAQSLLPTIPASFLTFSTVPLYPVYGDAALAFGPLAVADQTIAGVIMKLGGGLLLWSTIAVIWFRWTKQERESGSVSSPRFGPPEVDRRRRDDSDWSPAVRRKAPARGVVTSVDGTLEDVTSFVVLVEGSELEFTPTGDGEYDFPLSHLREHQRTGEPVLVGEMVGSVRYALSLADG